MIDLSNDSPVDAIAADVCEALITESARPEYPTVHGSDGLRAVITSAVLRRYGITNLADSAVLPVIGGQEFIAWLPTQLGIRSSVVAIPELSEPTYEFGALLANCSVVRTDENLEAAENSALIYLNSPSNPTGKVSDVNRLRSVVDWARANDVIVVSDERSIGFGYESPARSILDPDVCAGDHTNLLSLHSLSKSSNLASYRAGFVAGDGGLVAELLQVRRHAGMMVPLPVQSAMLVALQDDKHEQNQRQTYRGRRAILLSALVRAGFSVDRSAAGLYLWATRGEDCWMTTKWFAARGVLVTPGIHFGENGRNHVRIALTSSDEEISAVADRIQSMA